MASARTLRIATRGSALARWQADHVAALLRANAGVDVEFVVVTTQGDTRIDVPISAIGGQGVFVKEVQAAVLDGRADLAVHSAKDLPSVTADGLVIAAVPERGDPRDTLVGSTLDGLPVGGRVATGSVRRRAQLASLRPDLTFQELRGNIDTRLAKLADAGVDAIVVAQAALERLGRDVERAEVLAPSLMLPQVGQGALAVECRAGDDDGVRALLAGIEHLPSRRTVDAERAFLAQLGSGCDLPVAAHATVAADGTLTMDAMLARLDGHVVLRASGSGGTADDPAAIGASVARELLDVHGGRTLLDEIQGLG